MNFLQRQPWFEVNNMLYALNDIVAAAGAPMPLMQQPQNGKPVEDEQKRPFKG
jgi:hypothetical protein